MRQTLLFLQFFLFFASAASAQNADSLAAEKQFKRFKELRSEEKYDEALQALDWAIVSFHKAKLLDKWLLLQANKGRFMAKERNQPFEALEYMDHCSTGLLWKAPATRLEHIEHCYYFLDQFYIAKQYAEDFVKAKRALEKAYEIFHKDLGANENGIAAFLYFQFANTYVRLGEYSSAKRIFEEGLAYSYAHNAPEVAKYCDYGGMYITSPMPNYPEAKKLFLEGIARKGVPEEDIVFTKIALIECLAQMGDLEEALKANKRLEYALKMPFKDPRAASKLPVFRYNVQEINGIIYSKKGDKKSALFWYREALKTAQGYANNTKRQCAFFEVSIGDLLMDIARPKEALDAYHAALKTIIPKFNAPVGQHPAQENLKAENIILRALHGKARAFQALFQPEKSLECYELIPFVEAKLRATHAYESSSLLALKESRQRFNEAIDIAWQLYGQSNGNPKYTERAFRLTELARGMLLLQSLVQARQFLPDDIRNKDYELRVRMAWLEHEIAAEQDAVQTTASPKISTWERQLFELKLEHQKLLADYPAYNSPDSLFLQVLAAKDVRSLLRPGQAMADYFLTETAAYIFSFDAEGVFGWRKAVLPQGFREKTRAFATYLWADEKNGREQFLRQAWLLDSLLLAPERQRWGKNANSLVIVPDDVLMLVPFEVLLSRPTPTVESTWREQHWLLADYNFAYAYSATLLNVQKRISEEHKTAAAKPTYNFGGFAPSYSKSGEYKLQNTRPMVKKVRDQLGGKAWLDSDASEERFKNSAAKCQTLLLAMHGISDPDHPELSRLLFGDPGPQTEINNNILYASELQIMRLQADLVVLSACHSGAGKLEMGEGVYSLARAFAAARVPATVMSLWLLHENTAPPLVESFFSYLQQGKTKDEALRQAKLDFLKIDENFEMTHPFYWAGLTAAGDMRALDLSDPAPGLWWILGTAVLLAVGLWWWWRRRRIPSSDSF